MGSILSRSEPRQSSGVSSAEESTRGAKCAVAIDLRRRVEVKKDTSKVSRRGIQTDPIVDKPNKPKSGPRPSTKEKRKALTLIKKNNLTQNAKTKNCRRSEGINQGNRAVATGKDRSMTHAGDFPCPMKNNSEILPSDSTHCKNDQSLAFNVENKENVVQTMKGNLATQARPLSDEHRYRQPLQPIKTCEEIQTGSNENQHEMRHSQPKDGQNSTASVHRLQKKLRPASSPLTRKNGSKGSGDARNNSIKEDLKSNQEDTSNERNRTAYVKAPLEHPCAVLGAIPWMYAKNEHDVAITPSGFNGSQYGGHSHFQPVFTPINSWGYPAHAHQWTMPPFLAPLAATMRHPFANFMSNYGVADVHHYHQNHACNPRHGPYYPRGPVENGQMPMEAEAIVVSSKRLPVEKSSDLEESDEEITDSQTEEHVSGTSEVEVVDAKLSEEDAAKVQCEEVDLPSTFAPLECVQKIRARLEASKARMPSNGGKNRNFSESTKASHPKTEHQTSSTRMPVTRSKSKCNGLKVKETVTTTSTDASVQVMNILGKRVTMVDPVRKVFIIDLLSPETCDKMRRLTDNYVRGVVESGSNAETWRTLYTYTKMDLPVVEVTDMTSKYTDRILHDVKKIVGEIFGMKKEAMKLRPRSWKEPHLLLYQVVDGKPPHTGIEMHYDGCDITWQAMLTRLDEYEGGGTYFRCLRKTVRLQQGQVLVHPGELYHKGLDITYGVRCLLVCFTDGMNPKILDDSKQEDDSSEYEDNVVVY